MTTAATPPTVVIALTTVGDESHARQLAHTLVDERLAACVNILPAMTSIYRWQGSVSEDREHQVIMKTTRDRLDALRARVHELHSYELPEFLVIATDDASAAYRGWVEESVRPDVRQ